MIRWQLCPVHKRDNSGWFGPLRFWLHKKMGCQWAWGRGG